MNASKLRRQSIALLVGYALQFLAGMSLNLFVTIPSKHPGSSGNNYASRSWHSLLWTLAGHGGWALAFHVYLGILLALGSVSLGISALAQHNKNWAMVGSIAAVFTLGAFFNGLSFVDFNKNISSMIMAICWLVAVGVLVFGLVKFPRKLSLKTSNK